MIGPGFPGGEKIRLEVENFTRFSSMNPIPNPGEGASP